MAPWIMKPGIICTEEGIYDATTFLRFFGADFAGVPYPTGKIIMVLDNTKIHHTKRTQSFLEENRKPLEFTALPPYKSSTESDVRSLETAQSSSHHYCLF